MNNEPHHPLPQPNTLTGSRAATWNALTAHPGSTAAAIADLAGYSYPATHKALVNLEQHHLATRQPGTSSSTGRNPDRWHPNPAALTTPPTQNNPDSGPSPTMHAPTTDASTAGGESTTRPNTPEPTRHTPAQQDEKEQDTPWAQHPHDLNGNPHDKPTLTEPDRASSHTPHPASTPAETSENAPSVTVHPVTSPTIRASAGKPRLARGALQQMVLDHLQAHPTSSFTATGISRAIDSSSGAIANALTVLTQRRLTEMVTEKPRTYRVTTSATSQS